MKIFDHSHTMAATMLLSVTAVQAWTTNSTKKRRLILGAFLLLILLIVSETNFGSRANCKVAVLSRALTLITFAWISTYIAGLLIVSVRRVAQLFEERQTTVSSKCIKIFRAGTTSCVLLSYSMVFFRDEASNALIAKLSVTLLMMALFYLFLKSIWRLLELSTRISAHVEKTIVPDYSLGVDAVKGIRKTYITKSERAIYSLQKQLIVGACLALISIMRSFYAVTESVERLMHGVQRNGWCSKELEHNELFHSLQLYVPLFLLWYTWTMPFHSALEICYTKTKRRRIISIGKFRSIEGIEGNKKMEPARPADKSDDLNREHGTHFFSPVMSVPCGTSTMRQRTVCENVQQRHTPCQNIHFHHHRLQTLTRRVMNSIPEEEDELKEEKELMENSNLHYAANKTPIFVGRC
mmetsp:Transcript_385/g.552  ORF Transcript_385/g.552 Transcript_385/m.552 type:complete len:410 (-) Transcript_385:251-1480(-)